MIDAQPRIAQSTVRHPRLSHREIKTIPAHWGRLSSAPDDVAALPMGLNPGGALYPLYVGELWEIEKITHGPCTEGHALMIQPSGDGAFRLSGIYLTNSAAERDCAVALEATMREINNE